ncbi:MAG: hypothetical protein Q9185_004797 [Variospora sp. 1 TL-2023]
MPPLSRIKRLLISLHLAVPPASVPRFNQRNRDSLPERYTGKQVSFASGTPPDAVAAAAVPAGAIMVRKSVEKEYGPRGPTPPPPPPPSPPPSHLERLLAACGLDLRRQEKIKEKAKRAEEKAKEKAKRAEEKVKEKAKAAKEKGKEVWKGLKEKAKKKGKGN